MDNTNEEICEACGAQMKEWWHTLTPGLVATLIKVVKVIKNSGKNDYHLQVKGELDNNEFSNFPKLRVHGLVARVKDKNTGEVVHAHWLLTAKAGQFLRGEIAIPHKVKTFRGKVKDYSPETRTIADFRGKVSWFESDFNFEIHDGIIRPKTGVSSVEIKLPVKPLAEGIYEVTGANNKTYKVRQDAPGYWSCECEGYRYSSKKKCKHTEAVAKHVRDLAAAEVSRQQRAIF
jgi:hypothetical protein